MTVGRSISETLLEMRGRVRLEVNDADSLSQRWTNTEVNQAINDSVRFLIREKSNRDPGELLQYEDLTYSGKWFALGTTIGGASILKVEVIDSPDNPTIVEYVPITILETIKGATWSSPVKVYSLSGDSDERKIGIRASSGSSFEIRVWYLSEALTAVADGDPMPLQPVWLRLVQLHAAKSLRSIEGEWTLQQEGNLQEMRLLWSSHAQAGGPRIIPARRRN